MGASGKVAQLFFGGDTLCLLDVKKEANNPSTDTIAIL